MVARLVIDVSRKYREIEPETPNGLPPVTPQLIGLLLVVAVIVALVTTLITVY